MEEVEVNGKIMRFKQCQYNTRQSILFYRTKIFEAFDKIGVESKYVNVSFGGAGGYRANAWAKVEWVVNGETFNCTCNSQQSDVQNLAAIAQVIENDSKAIRRGLKSFGMVMNQFRIEYNPDGQKVKSPREILGVPETIMDPDYIEFRFRSLSKEYHPDHGGDPEKFKEIVEARAQLMKEVGQ